MRPAKGAGGAAAKTTLGRPRDPGANDAILTATIDLISEVGTPRLTIAAVAARAGVSKGTIYRRWPSLTALVMAAVQKLPVLEPWPAGDSVADDLRLLLRSLVAALSGSMLGKVLAHLAAERDHNTQLDAEFARYTEERRAPIVEAIRRGIERKEIPSHCSPFDVADMIVGPITNRAIFLGWKLDDDFIDLVIDSVLRGLRAGNRS